MIDPELIQAENQARLETHKQDLADLRRRIDRSGLDTAQILSDLAALTIAVPSWALGTGGTRFGRFPGPGEPTNVYEKLDDAAVIHQLTQCTPRVSLHIPWDEPDHPVELNQHAAARGLSFDAVNSNTFQDQPGQPYSYKFGSLSHTDSAVRTQAVEHHEHVIQVGQQLGSNAITIWLADGSNFPGQVNLRKSFQRTLESLQQIYALLPSDWQIFIEHKPFEPAFYATVVQDWGSSLMLAQALGKRASCLVDLGHHLPNTNVEQVVARLIASGKLGGFHFNDSSYGDDDLTAGSIRPYQLFLVFSELVDAQCEFGPQFSPAYMIDQSHNLKDPIEALLVTADNLQQAYAKALLVDRTKLARSQNRNDVSMAEQELQRAFQTDVRPLVREARRNNGGALDPLGTFRYARYRESVAAKRTASTYRPPQSL